MAMATKRKRGQEVKRAATKAKAHTKKPKKYGRYNSYKDYCENIILQPMRELFDVLEEGKDHR